MATRVLLPKQGLQMVEGRIVRWLRKVGEPVAEGDDIVQIETDKATIDVQAPAAGVVLAILRQEGETVPVAETIAVIGAPGEDYAALAAGIPAPAASSPIAAASPAVASPPRAEPVRPQSATTPVAGGRRFSSPRARMAAEQAGIDIRTLAGSGPDGLVIERDVKAAAASAVSPAPAPLAAPGRLVQPSRMRSVIARTAAGCRAGSSTNLSIAK